MGRADSRLFCHARSACKFNDTRNAASMACVRHRCFSWRCVAVEIGHDSIGTASFLQKMCLPPLCLWEMDELNRQILIRESGLLSIMTGVCFPPLLNFPFFNFLLL